MKYKNLALILSGILLTIILISGIFGFILVVIIPEKTIQVLGDPNPALDNSSRILYSAKLYLKRDLLLTPYSQSGTNMVFEINSGESASDVVKNLTSAKLIMNPGIFTDYLVYKGIDKLLQAGSYVLNPAMNPIEMASFLYDTTPQDITFSFLPGWRAEEIAALLPTSGLNISKDDFLNLVKKPPKSLSEIISPETTSLEGYLFPNNYQVMKSATAEEFISLLLLNFNSQLPNKINPSLKKSGLSFGQAIILASIVEKEAVLPEEAPLIASVFINRLNSGMPLQSDPTVQYALGYSAAQKTWWKNPLASEDLLIESPYNTYTQKGLPPTPICNPGLKAIRAVLEPANSDFLYFRAACNSSGEHSFSRTYEDHLKAACK